MEQYKAIVKHPYIERQKKYFFLLQNATVESIKTFMVVLDIAEEMCTCSNEHFKKLLPIFKESYSLVGDANAEIEFIKKQRKEREIL